MFRVRFMRCIVSNPLLGDPFLIGDDTLFQPSNIVKSHLLLQVGIHLYTSNAPSAKCENAAIRLNIFKDIVKCVPRLTELPSLKRYSSSECSTIRLIPIPAIYGENRNCDEQQRGKAKIGMINLEGEVLWGPFQIAFAVNFPPLCAILKQKLLVLHQSNQFHRKV